jgi:hypothetical protein
MVPDKWSSRVLASLLELLNRVSDVDVIDAGKPHVLEEISDANAVFAR